MENKFKESVYIEQVMVIGEGEKHPAALITPSVDALNDWATKNKLNTSSLEELCKEEAVLNLYQQELSKFNKEFSNYERAKKFELLPVVWDIDGGEMTPTLKLKRRHIMSKYADVINKIYPKE